MKFLNYINEEDYLQKPGYVVTRSNDPSRKNPLFIGTRIQCLSFMDKNWKKHNSMIDLIGPDGRMSSFDIDKELPKLRTKKINESKTTLSWTDAELKYIQDEVFGPGTSTYEAMELKELRQELEDLDKHRFTGKWGHRKAKLIKTKKEALLALADDEYEWMDREEEDMLSSAYRYEAAGEASKEYTKRHVAKIKNEMADIKSKIKARVKSYILSIKEY